MRGRPTRQDRPRARRPGLRARLFAWREAIAPGSCVAFAIMIASGNAIGANEQASARVPVPRTRNEPVESMVVYGRADQQLGVAASASEGRVARADLELRPIGRVGELLEAVPGLIATQHSGPGKSKQLFLRGFNLDHGTDFAVHLDGVPVNFRTHAHGQGYLDLNFLIPELVEGIGNRRPGRRISLQSAA